MQAALISQKTHSTTQTSVRLHYLDWLRVLAIFGVFLYHSVHPFDLLDWHIKNSEQSVAITAAQIFVSPWGMPFFFLIAGTGTWFALKRRTIRQYIGERFKRLFVPFIFGCIVLTPIMLYLEWSHKTQMGLFNDTFWAFFASRKIPFTPNIFGWAGYHLWFLGFLFSYSILGIPFFLQLKDTTDRRWISWLVKRCEQRGGILLAIIPLTVVQLALRIFFITGEHNWADFFYLFLFFILGYILYTDERFIRALWRDRWLVFMIAIGTSATALVVAYSGDLFTWLETPRIPEFYLIWTLSVVNSWCWTLLLLLIGIRFLDFSNRWLGYSQQAILPFFVFHQPVIMLIAFFVVQWDAPILPKLLVVVFSSLVVTLGLYELFVKHIGFMRTMLGMKS